MNPTNATSVMNATNVIDANNVTNLKNVIDANNVTNVMNATNPKSQRAWWISVSLKRPILG